MGRQVILGRLGAVLDLLCLSLKSVCTKVEFSRMELLKSCPLFTPYSEPFHAFLRTLPIYEQKRETQKDTGATNFVDVYMLLYFLGLTFMTCMLALDKISW